jgi:hypothetical protein
MDSCEFFLEQYNTVCSIVNDLFLKGVTDEQMRHQPDDGLNSMAWYLWHTALLARLRKHSDRAQSCPGFGCAMARADESFPARRWYRNDAAGMHLVQSGGEGRRRARVLGCRWEGRARSGVLDPKR